VLAIHSQFPTFLALIRLVLRLLPLVAVGLAVVVMGTGCFLAAKGLDTMPVEQDAIAFAPSMAVGTAVAAAVALALGGKRKLAGAVFLASLLATIVVSAVIYALLYIEPLSLRNQMDAWSFLRLRSDAEYKAWKIAQSHAPFAAWAGLVVGLYCGLISIAARRRPRVAVIATMALIFGLAVEPVQQVVSGAVTWSYWLFRWSVGAWPVDQDKTPELGAWFGAIAGALIAAVVIEASRRKAQRAERAAPDRATGAGEGWPSPVILNP
jgi:hypothetical protein